MRMVRASVLLVLLVTSLSGCGLLRGHKAQTTAVTPDTQALHPGGQGLKPNQPAAPTEPGLVLLDDFQVTIPQGWERRKDLEDEGPGTKLFLVGPEISNTRLVVGIDTYPLKTGTTLEAFVKQYRARWATMLPTTDKPAALCGQPAHMIGFSEGGLDKLFILCVWREKGFILGMIGPTDQSQKALPLFRAVIDTFQVYE
jgi:hypothetical protein